MEPLIKPYTSNPFLDGAPSGRTIKDKSKFRGKYRRTRLLAESTGTNGDASGAEGTSSPQFSSNILISRVPSVGSNPTLSATFFGFSFIHLGDTYPSLLAN
jgi:hypothetical protein